MVSACDVGGTQDVVALASCDWGGPIAEMLTVQQAQREQAEVGLVAPVDKAEVGVEVVAVGRPLLLRGCFLITVNAAAQQLLIL